MELVRYVGKELEGIVFDGSFESSVAIAEMLKAKYQHRVSQFGIQHFNSGSRIGQTNLSFVIEPLKGEPNARNEEFTLYVGDFLRIQPSNLEVISHSLLKRYWTPAE